VTAPCADSLELGAVTVVLSEGQSKVGTCLSNTSIAKVQLCSSAASSNAVQVMTCSPILKSPLDGVQIDFCSSIL
jgi:hypothetical protein